MPQQRPKVVIIGAGFGGLEAAKALSRVAVDVILIVPLLLVLVLALDQHAPFEPMTAWPPAASATAATCARSASPHELHWIVRHFDRFSVI